MTNRISSNEDEKNFKIRGGLYLIFPITMLFFCLITASCTGNKKINSDTNDDTPGVEELVFDLATASCAEKKQEFNRLLNLLSKR